MAATIALWVVAALLVVVGFVGTVLPALPGPGLVLAGLALAAWIDDFERVGGSALAVMATLAVLTYVVDFGASVLGAKGVGASRRAMIGALLGVAVGLFFGLPGVLLGPFVGAVLGEYSARRNLGQAGRAGLGAWLGLVLGSATKLALVLAMIGAFGVAWLR